MKKIIELAVKSTGHHETALAAYSSFLEFKAALLEYKRLSETPITEEWLKEHGWQKETLDEWEYWYIETGGCKLAVEELNGHWFIGNTPLKLNSLADIYDACELCGINLEELKYGKINNV